MEPLEDRRHLSATAPQIAVVHGLIDPPAPAITAKARAHPNKVRVSATAPSQPVRGATTPADFFPIGVWYQPTYLFQHWKDAGINTMVGWESEGGAVSMNTWDSYAAYNHFYTIRQPNKHPERDKANTNLLAWLLGDEPDLHATKSTALASQYASLKAADPTRPVFVNFDGSRVLGWQGNMSSKGYKAYLASADWSGSDVYPVTGWNLPTRLTAPGDAAYRLSAYSDGKPQFAFIETSDQELPWLPRSVPGPNASQLRGEIWAAINRGAKGIVYFPQRIGWGFAFDSTPKTVLAEMARQNAILSALGGPLESPLNPPGLSASVDAPLERSWRSYNGKSYFIVTNMSNAPVDTKIHLAGANVTPAGPGSATVFNESRTITTTDGAFTDHFARYETHVYIEG